MALTGARVARTFTIRAAMDEQRRDWFVGAIREGYLAAAREHDIEITEVNPQIGTTLDDALLYVLDSFEDEPTAWRPLMFGDELWVLLLCGEAGIMLQVNPGGSVETRFVGPLTGARYTEQLAWREEEKRQRLVARFEHDALPNGAFEFEAAPSREIRELAQFRDLLKHLASTA